MERANPQIIKLAHAAPTPQTGLADSNASPNDGSGQGGLLAITGHEPPCRGNNATMNVSPPSAKHHGPDVADDRPLRRDGDRGGRRGQQHRAWEASAGWYFRRTRRI